VPLGGVISITSPVGFKIAVNQFLILLKLELTVKIKKKIKK
jgi:hypothetical protein